MFLPALKSHGSYQGFEYDAIAIAYENTDIVDVLDISAFDGNAKSYVVHPDGRVVVDRSFESWGNAYNFFGVLREHSDMSEKEILALSEKFKARTYRCDDGKSGWRGLLSGL